MKQTIINKGKGSVNMMAKVLGAAFFILHSSFFISCSDVEYEAANYSEAVRNLIAEYQQGNRQVTLRWDNPTMQ